MTDAISQIGQRIAEEAATQGQEAQGTQVQSPDEKDVAQFERAMGTQQADAVDPSAETPQVEEARSAKEAAPGDQILQGIEKIRESHEAHVNNINEILESKGNEPLSVQEALTLQYELIQLNFQQELTSKGADKSSQAVQSVLRNQ